MRGALPGSLPPLPAAMASPASPPFRPVTHLIFDMDGLLLDTERLYSRVFGEICGRHGRAYTWAAKARAMGRTAPEAAAMVVEELGLPLTPRELLDESRARLAELFPSAGLMPGAERLLLHLGAHGVPCALATGSDSAAFALKTRRHRRLFSLFRHAVLGDDPEVAAGKPHPDIFLACARRFRPDPPDPAQCLVLEDAPHGVDAALAAGMQVVMVPDPALGPELTARATLVLPSLGHLRPELFGLPAFE